MIGNPAKIIKWLTDQPLDSTWEIKRKREKRSLSQNDYYWVLVTSIADVLRLSKTEVHNMMLRDYGRVWRIVGRLSQVWIPDTDAAEAEVLRAETYHLKPTSHTKTNDKGETYRTYLLLRGSSDYDSKEMTILLDGTIREAESLGIETLTPEERARLK